ncbi:mRNA 3' end processing factor [Dimargaris verticillata]|uniref:mRNA 3' end processing factor n=1 Tax=Dimargaris verticillata TaxID=2761393 RepID=A0A9W8B9C2_9FUNG|nr:mRNA 3' end processing factor [Dimargaris verticillata]
MSSLVSNAELRAVRSDYLASLSDLISNERPVIKNLTIIAEENLHAAPAIVDAIQARMKQAPRHQKLHVLYLIDSICKNVRRDYLSLFADCIVSLFTTTYHQVPDKDKSRFCHVLDTWRSSGKRPPVFPPRVIAEIDRRLRQAPSRRTPSPMPAPRPPQSAPAPASAQPGTQPPTNPVDVLKLLSTLSGVTSAPTPAPQVPASAQPGSLTTNVSALLQSLLNPGVPTALPASPIPGMPSHMTPPQNSGLDIAVITLTNDDIQQKRPGLAEKLYSAYPGQCKQCAIRFRATEDGKRQYQAHLDWHFRRNRRLKESKRRAQPRGWFLSEQDWVDARQLEAEAASSAAIFESSVPGTNGTNHDGTLPSDQHGSAADGGGSPTNDEANGSDDTLLRAMTVVVPAQQHNSVCPICNEKLVGVWDDDEEEWVYRNAILVDNTVYHATCRTASLRNATAAKPQGSMAAFEGSPLAAGIKRKPLDDDDLRAKEYGTPEKRLATALSP